MKTLSNYVSPKNEVVKYFLKLISDEVDVDLYTVRPENAPLAYIRLMAINSSDRDYKNIQTGIVRLKFNIYSADPSVKEVMEIIQKMEGASKEKIYQCPYVYRMDIRDIFVQDVNKPDIRQGEIAFELHYYN